LLFPSALRSRLFKMFISLFQLCDDDANRYFPAYSESAPPVSRFDCKASWSFSKLHRWYLTAPPGFHFDLFAGVNSYTWFFPFAPFRQLCTAWMGVKFLMLFLGRRYTFLPGLRNALFEFLFCSFPLMCFLASLFKEMCSLSPSPRKKKTPPFCGPDYLTPSFSPSFVPRTFFFCSSPFLQRIP